MKGYHKYLLDTIRAKGERDFVKKNQKSDPKLAKDQNGNDNKTFSGAGVSELEGAKTLHAGNLPGEDASQYEEVSPEIKAKLAANKEKKSFTVHLKHLVKGTNNTATVKAKTPEDAMDKADSQFPNHEPVKAVRILNKEETELTLIDVLDESMRLTPEQKQKREDLVKGMKSQVAGFKKRYGDRWKSVMYATATKLTLGEEVRDDADGEVILEELVEKCITERLSDAKIKTGALHKQEGIKQDKKIGKKRLKALKKRGTKKEKKRAIWALNINKNKHEEVQAEDVMGIGTDFSELSPTAKTLMFHAENTDHLKEHKQAYISNMARRMKKGTYDSEKGKKLWGYFADHAATDYAHEHALPKPDKGTFEPHEWRKAFPTSVRKEVAAHYENKHREQLQNSIHEAVIDEMDYESLIDDMRYAVIEQLPVTLEFTDESEKEIKPKKIGKFLEIFEFLDKDDQDDLILIISENYDNFKEVISEHNNDECFCHHCGNSLDKEGSMHGVLRHIDDHKVPREVALRAIMRQSHKDVDEAINRHTMNQPTAMAAPVNAIPVRVV